MTDMIMENHIAKELTRLHQEIERLRAALYSIAFDTHQTDYQGLRLIARQELERK